MKRRIIKILVLAGALAVWDLVLKDLYYSWAGESFGTATLGYAAVLGISWGAAWLLTRKDGRDLK